MKRTILALALVATTFGAFAQTPAKATTAPAAATTAPAPKAKHAKKVEAKKAVVKTEAKVEAPKADKKK
ncbi:hypothetical protein [Pedobacter sp. MC2016-24]|uniref:hypothetical protein n=1 Tax=Pedobacter sp. MC2016-24 TaxID=2780090 RepID=UPI00187E1E3D|nr:hypothetical protein [Pedobacter sp. MC2016-24]MBE9601244.1 hypothetical protein [Pedobacter sp. MC2016-24]